MKQQWLGPRLTEASFASNDDGDGRFCPECGQSLDLARHREAPVKRRTLEPLVFLIFGLCLTVAFGLRVWQTHTQLSRLDQQIADRRARAAEGPLPKPGNPSMIVADTMDDLPTGQAALQVGFQRDLTGLGLGMFTIIVGAVSWLHERPETVDRQRKRMSAQRLPPSSHSQVEGIPSELGGLVAITLVRKVLLLFVTTVGLQLNRGVPPSSQLVDEALTRIVVVIVCVVGALS